QSGAVSRMGRSSWPLQIPNCRARPGSSSPRSVCEKSLVPRTSLLTGNHLSQRRRGRGRDPVENCARVRQNYGMATHWGGQALTTSEAVLDDDDEPSIRDLLQTSLSKEGYEVRVAKDGFDALAQMRGALPDLILTDLKMPNMSGFEFLSVVRR